MMRLKQQDQHRRELHEGEEVACELLEAHRDAPEALDALEEVLDQAPVLVEVRFDLPTLRPGGVRRDHHLAAARLEALDEVTSVVRHVAGYVGVMDLGEQFVRELHLVGLPGR